MAGWQRCLRVIAIALRSKWFALTLRRCVPPLRISICNPEVFRSVLTFAMMSGYQQAALEILRTKIRHSRSDQCVSASSSSCHY